MIRLALIFGVPPHEVMGWPGWVVSSLHEYLRKEPAPVERVEYGLAQLAAIQVNMNRKKGTAAHTVNDFMLFSSAWGKPKESQQETIGPAEMAAMIGARMRVR